MKKKLFIPWQVWSLVWVTKYANNEVVIWRYPAADGRAALARTRHTALSRRVDTPAIPASAESQLCLCS